DFRAAVNGHAFTDDIVVTDLEQTRFTAILHVRGIFTHGRELEYTVAFADAGRSLDDHVRSDFAVVTDFHVWTDDGPRSDAHIVADACLRIDDGVVATFHCGIPCLRMCCEGVHSLRSAQRIVASQATSPSTEALHSNL